MFKGNSTRNGLHQFVSMCTEGDLNEDGNNDILDILQQVNIILGVIEPTIEQICAADMNSDNTIDLLDVIILVQLALDS